jgi:hypothetical protein
LVMQGLSKLQFPPVAFLTYHGEFQNKVQFGLTNNIISFVALCDANGAEFELNLHFSTKFEAILDICALDQSFLYHTIQNFFYCTGNLP